MTSVSHDPVVTSDAHVAEQPLRVQLKPAAPNPGGTGYVDGAWWPRSRDLAAELPALMQALATRLGAVERLAYNLGEWEPADRHVTAGHSRVRLDGFRSQGAGTVDAIAARGRFTLLVIPPESSADNAREIALASADASNLEPAGALLAHVAKETS